MDPTALQMAFAFAWLPEREDIFALPTSAALTGWDAAFIMIPVGLAFVAIIAGALPASSGAKFWRYRHILAVEGIAYLWFSEVALSLILVGLAMLSTILLSIWQQNGPLHGDAQPAPQPASALWQRVGELFYGIVLGSALAAAIKVLLPTIDVPALALMILGLFAGLLLPLSPAMSAIPALALVGLDGGVLAGASLLLTAMLRQVAADSGRSWLPVIARYLRPTRTGQ